MIRAMSSALSGLRNHQLMLDVVAQKLVQDEAEHSRFSSPEK